MDEVQSLDYNSIATVRLNEIHVSVCNYGIIVLLAFGYVASYLGFYSYQHLFVQ